MKYNLSKFLTGLIFFPLMISSVSVRTAAMESHHKEFENEGLSHDDEDIEEFYLTADSPESKTIENVLYDKSGILVGTTIKQKRDFVDVFYLVSKSLYEYDEGLIKIGGNLGKHIRNNDKTFYEWLEHDATNNDRTHFKIGKDEYQSISTERYEAIKDKLKEFFTKLSTMGYWDNQKNCNVLKYACSQTNAYAKDDSKNSDNQSSDSDFDSDSSVYSGELEVNSEYEKVERDDPFEGLDIKTVGDADCYLPRDPVNDKCSICLGGFFDKSAPKNILVLTDCLHGFHEECLEKWLKKNDTCPNCKFDLCSEEPRKVDRWKA